VPLGSRLSATIEFTEHAPDEAVTRGPLQVMNDGVALPRVQPNLCGHSLRCRLAPRQRRAQTVGRIVDAVRTGRRRTAGPAVAPGRRWRIQAIEFLCLQLSSPTSGLPRGPTQVPIPQLRRRFQAHNSRPHLNSHGPVVSEGAYPCKLAALEACLLKRDVFDGSTICARTAPREELRSWRTRYACDALRARRDRHRSTFGHRHTPLDRCFTRRAVAIGSIRPGRRTVATRQHRPDAKGRADR
jgi:hypothetical protein